MPLKKKLRANETTVGSWITLGHSAVAELMARVGFDWLVIDMEHSVIGLRDAQEMMQAIDLGGVPPLVRLTSNDANQIKRMMDAGAHGVVVPLVNSAADAKRVVDAVYYPPRGTRGVGLARAQGYGASFADYKAWLKDNAVVIVMIEHIKAVEAIDEILAEPGVDGYIIGPYDLSSSLGIPGEFDNPKVVEAIERIRKAGKKAKKAGGIHVVEPDLKLIKRYIDDGFTFIGYGMDVRFLDSICRDHLPKIRKFA